jgi:hypothetical protein
VTRTVVGAPKSTPIGVLAVVDDNRPTGAYSAEREAARMSDIRFDGEYVIVEGLWTKLMTLDLMLDAPSRRSTAGGQRRALVHDFTDGLTVNWNNDYPGGVTVNGARRVRGHNGDWVDIESRVTQVKGTDLMLDSSARRTNTTAFRRALVHDFTDGLTVNWNNDYPGGVTLRGSVKMPNGATISGQDVASMFTTLTERIEALEARVAALEES